MAKAKTQKTTLNPGAAGTNGAAIASDALMYVGSPYVWGGAAGTVKGKDAGTDCAAEGSLVQTARGAVPIESVRPGDLVTSWRDGKSLDAPVAAVLDKGARGCVKVRMRNRSVVVTPDHRLPVLRYSLTGPRRSGRGGGSGTRTRVWSVEWTAAGSVQRGDYVVTLARVPAAGEPMSADLAWLAGLFTGDGDFPRDRTVRLCVFGELRERTRAAVAREFGVNGTDTDRHGLIVHSTLFRARLAGLGCVTGSAAKRVPEAIWTADAASRETFLLGYIAADGHRNAERHETSLHSCSPELLGGARMLAIGLGWNVGNIACNRRTRPIVIKGKTVKNARPLYSFTVYEGRNNRGPGSAVALDHMGASELFKDEFFTCERVLAVDDAGEHQVYDLMVPGPENFTADGVLVHNCSGFVNMVLGRDLGMAVPGYGAGQYTGAEHGGTVADYIAWGGATTLGKGESPTAGDLVCYGPDVHIGIATSAKDFCSALNPSLGTLVTDITGAASGTIVYRRVNGVGAAPTGAGGTSATGGLSSTLAGIVVGLGLGAGVVGVLVGVILGGAALLGLAGAAVLGAAIRRAGMG